MKLQVLLFWGCETLFVGTLCRFCKQKELRQGYLRLGSAFQVKMGE